MRITKILSFSLLAVCLAVVSFPAAVAAQTASTGAAAGTVTDPTGAVVPGVKVEFLHQTTQSVRTQTTNSAGQYLFSALDPGVYRITVTAQGFRTAQIAEFKVDVARSYNVNFDLEVGAVEQVVEVTAGTEVELQTLDSTVGDVVGGESLLRLPTSNRSAAALLTLQPLVSPPNVEATLDVGGQVAGARSDQTTFLLDGGDATSNTEGTGGYNIGFAGGPAPIVPVPAESVQEFRVGTTNPNATYGRSQGGQVSMMTKRGTNSLHGSVYWYHQNDNLNANQWDFNRTGVTKPELKDNRYGFSLGGPLKPDSTWLYGHYEGRRFPRTRSISRVVPTDTLKQGIIRFRDEAGNIVSYNLNPANGPLSTGCSGGACDPRGIGVSPVMQSLFALYPTGNDPSLGDGLNSIGFRTPVGTTLDTDFFVLRLDQKVSDTWSAFASYRYGSTRQPGFQQVDITGLTGSGVSSTRQNPLEPRFAVAGLTGQITPNLTSETRVSWFRHWWEWATTGPFPQVSGTAAAIDVGTEDVVGTLSEPINIDTQNARARIWNGKDTYISQNMTWIKGTHTVHFGGNFRYQDIFHMRTDKVLGGLTTGPIYYSDTTSGDGSFATIPSSFRPPICDGAGVTTTCLQSGDLNRWDVFYSNLLGIIDRGVQIGTRDGQLVPNPLGQNLTANVDIYAYEFFAQDTWRLNPSFTLTYGLTYQVQLPPFEQEGKQMMVVFEDTQEPVFLDSYFQRRREAAEVGQIYNPNIAYSPIRSVAGMKYPTDIDWNNFGPRVAASWNPSFQNPIFGDRQTVIRGGYSVTYSRMNGVGLVMTPILGIGLAEGLTCGGPDTTGTCGAGSGPADLFRIGVDGNSLSLPAPGPPQIPFPVAAPFGEVISFALDPGMKLGISHSLDVTWQRELPGDLLLEFGYVGRLGRNLTQGADLNSTPFFMLDPASGQILGQAFDLVAEELRAGVNPSSVTPQPWFENQTGAGSTQALAGAVTGEFINGDLAGAFLFGADFFAPQPFNNLQSVFNSFTTDGGKSWYNAAFVSLRKRMSHGLTFSVNYTMGNSIDQLGLNQENVFGAISPFDLSIDKAPSLWDKRHTMNANWLYELPLGEGRSVAFDSAAANKVLGGWYISGIVTASSGLPLCVSQAAVGNFGGTLASGCAILTGAEPDPGIHEGVTGSGGVGVTGDTNMFANPETVFNNFRPLLVSVDGQHGRGHLRGMSRWNTDISLGKKTSITERVNIVFSFDFLNIFNHLEIKDAGSEDALANLDLSNPSSFGVLSEQFNQPRFIQFGFRIEF